MPADAEVVYKDHDAIVAELIAALQARVPDANLTADSIWRIWIEVMASTAEGLYLAWQLLHDDMFIQTANGVALIRDGDMFGRPLKTGTKATGSIRVSGAGGTSVPANTQVAAPQTADEALTFSVTIGGTIPNPGIPTAPTLADGGVAGTLPAGTYQYAVSFVTAEGETKIGALSAPLTIVVNHKITLTAIPLGGPGTTARRLYRSVDGINFVHVTGADATLLNNTTVTIDDTNLAASGAPLTDSTAERLTVTALADDVGSQFNVGIGTITQFVSTLPGLTDVTNLAAFTGGSEDEDLETFRAKLLEWVRAPKSGSPTDLKAWAEAVDGVETATVFQNDNLGVATPGHNTIRITGPEGSVPGAAVINAVLAELQLKDLAGITLHVATFTPVAVNVLVVITLLAGYSLGDVTPGTQTAISDYINSTPVGGTVYRAGITDAVFGLPGVATLSVTTPAADTTVTATQKAVPGTITVT